MACSDFGIVQAASLTHASKSKRTPAQLYKGATVPHKLTGMYHSGALDAENSCVHRYFPALGARGFPKALVGLESAPGHMPPGWAGPTKLNQDRGCVAYPMQDDRSAGLFAVLDGHGTQGQRVSEYCVVQLAAQLQASQDLSTDPAKALRSCFRHIDKQVKAAPGVDTQESGSTACVLYFRDSQLWTAVLGDSRAVAGIETAVDGIGIVLEAHRLTEDQKPEDPAEEARILAAGGYVGDGRVWLCKDSEEGGLAVSRAFGDHMFSKAGIVAEPVITEHTVRLPETKCIVVASDGLWEFVEDQEAINIVSGHPSASRAAAALLAEAKARWKKKGGGYRDDITIGVLYLPLWRKEVVASPERSPAAAPAAGAPCPPTESDDESDDDDQLAAMMLQVARSKAEAHVVERPEPKSEPLTTSEGPHTADPSEGIAVASIASGSVTGYDLGYEGLTAQDMTMAETEATDISPAASEQSFSMAPDSEHGGSVASLPKAKPEAAAFNLKDQVLSLMQSDSDTDSD